jgi:hypothetical protein
MRFLLCSLFALCLGLSTSRADIVMSIDLDTSTAGIQNTLDVTVGQTITGAVAMRITDSSVNGLSAYSATLLFDSDKFNLGPKTFSVPNPTPPPFTILANRKSTPPSGFATLGDQSDLSNQESGVSNTNPPLAVFYPNTGAFFNIAAGASTGGIGPDPTVLQIFEFTLTSNVATTISSDLASNPSLVLALVKPSDGFLDALNNPIPFSQLQGLAGPVAVPEPSSLAFLGMGGLYLVRRRLKRSKVAGC